MEIIERSVQERFHWVLRITSALCFIGHGAWGVITKAGWLPFFASQGIPESVAWQLMPLIGVFDIFLGVMLIWKPRRILLVFMLLWALWTAVLRPISGSPGMWEFWERAGNYFPSFILLVMSGGFAMKWKDWFGEYVEPRISLDKFGVILFLCRVAISLLLIGHGGFGVFVEKPMLIGHWNSIGLDVGMEFVRAVGWFEIFLGVSVLILPLRILKYWLWFVLVWKVFTEFLYVFDGGPLNIFEFIERWGDYGLPLGVIVLSRSDFFGKD